MKFENIEKIVNSKDAVIYAVGAAAVIVLLFSASSLVG